MLRISNAPILRLTHTHTHIDIEPRLYTELVFKLTNHSHVYPSLEFDIHIYLTSVCIMMVNMEKRWMDNKRNRDPNMGGKIEKKNFW